MSNSAFWRKIAAVTAVLTAIPLILAGCGGGSDAQTSKDGKPIVKVLVAEKNESTDVKKQAWTKKVEAACDCEIVWQSTRDFGDKKNPMLGSGDIPDLALNAFSIEDMAEYGELFEDLSKHLDQMPNVKKFLKTKPYARELVEDLDGHIYVLPSDRGESYQHSGQHLYVNKTWLDKLGLQIPKTWDEMLDVMEAFKTRDPNGNGQADEIAFNMRPMSSAAFESYSPYLFLNSTGIVTTFSAGPSTQGLYVKNGKMGSYMTSDNFKRVTKLLNEMMSRGYVPKDALTRDWPAYIAAQQSDGKTAKAGFAFGWSTLEVGGDFADQYVSILPPKENASMPDSDLVWDGALDYTEYEGKKVSVSANAKNKDAIYKIINELYDEKISVQQFVGSIPEYVKDDGNHTYTISPDFYKDSMALPALTDTFSGWIRPNVKLVGSQDLDPFVKDGAVYDQLKKNYDLKKDVIPQSVNPSAEDRTTIANNNATIFNYAMPVVSNWILKGGVDQEWDAYVKKVNDSGMAENVKLWQKWYDKYVTNRK